MYLAIFTGYRDIWKPACFNLEFKQFSVNVEGILVALSVSKETNCGTKMEDYLHAELRKKETKKEYMKIYVSRDTSKNREIGLTKQNLLLSENIFKTCMLMTACSLLRHNFVCYGKLPTQL